MAQVHTKSPYSTQEEATVPEYALPQSAAFAAPNPNEENGTMDSPIGAYSSPFKEEIGSSPDPFRLQHMVQRTVYPPTGKAPEEYYAGMRGADIIGRHSVETQDADGWEENKGSIKSFAANPRAVPPPEDRPTMRMAPRSYWFTRPLWGGPRLLNGEHFSMADHRRTYDILGTQPVRTWRNTYRVDPVPWDSGVVDIPPNNAGNVQAQAIQSIEVPFNNNPAYRLV